MRRQQLAADAAAEGYEDVVTEESPPPFLKVAEDGVLLGSHRPIALLALLRIRRQLLLLRFGYSPTASD